MDWYAANHNTINSSQNNLNKDDDMDSITGSINPIDSLASKMLRDDFQRAADIASASWTKYVEPAGIICGVKSDTLETNSNEPCSNLDPLHELVTEGPCLDSPTDDGYHSSSRYHSNKENLNNSMALSDHASITTAGTSNVDLAATTKHNVEVSYDYNGGTKATIVSYGTSSGTTVNEYKARARKLQQKNPAPGHLYTRGSLLNNRGSKRFKKLSTRTLAHI